MPNKIKFITLLISFLMITKSYALNSSKGDELVELGKYEEAIELYDKAIELDPANYDSYNLKGKALDSL